MWCGMVEMWALLVASDARATMPATLPLSLLFALPL
jgi:hypothetical protein